MQPISTHTTSLQQHQHALNWEIDIRQVVTALIWGPEFDRAHFVVWLTWWETLWRCAAKVDCCNYQCLRESILNHTSTQCQCLFNIKSFLDRVKRNLTRADLLSRLHTHRKWEEWVDLRHLVAFNQGFSKGLILACLGRKDGIHHCSCQII